MFDNKVSIISRLKLAILYEYLLYWKDVNNKLVLISLFEGLFKYYFNYIKLY